MRERERDRERDEREIFIKIEFQNKLSKREVIDTDSVSTEFC